MDTDKNVGRNYHSISVLIRVHLWLKTFPCNFALALVFSYLSAILKS